MSKPVFVYDFPRPSVTATIVIFGDHPGPVQYSVLTGVRKDKADDKHSAYPGYLCVPGGFLNAKVENKDVWGWVDGRFMNIEDARYDANLEDAVELDANNPNQWDVNENVELPGETVKQTAIREVFEETGLVIEEDELILFHESSNPNTDPRCHVVNLCYLVKIPNERLEKAVAGDDLSELKVLELELFDQMPEMAFDHADIVNKAIIWMNRFMT
jgi:NUDIX domain